MHSRETRPNNKTKSQQWHRGTDTKPTKSTILICINIKDEAKENASAYSEWIIICIGRYGPISHCVWIFLRPTSMHTCTYLFIKTELQRLREMENSKNHINKFSFFLYAPLIRLFIETFFLSSSYLNENI